MCVSLHWGALWDCFNQKEENASFPSLTFFGVCLHMNTAAFSCDSLLAPSGQRVRGDGWVWWGWRPCPLCYHIWGITALDLHLTVSFIYQVLESAGFLHVSYARS